MQEVEKNFVVKRALVIGGGIAGIQTALDIAEAGYLVDIVEKSAAIGGKMPRLDKLFPSLDYSTSILTPKIVEVSQHDNITLYTSSEVIEVSGTVGNFSAKIRKKVCAANAIDFLQEDEIVEKKYSVIIAATGFRQLSPKRYGEYGYGVFPDVLTSLEFERILSASGPTGGKLIRVSDSSLPKSIVFVQCVGSRADAKRGKTYCSKICCMYTAKHAMQVKEKHPDIEVNIFNIDIRTSGKNFDEFYRHAVEEYDVNYIKGMVGKVHEENGRLLVQATNMHKHLFIKADLVVLATAVEAEPDSGRLAALLTASIDQNGFFVEAHPKMRPVESPTSGILLAGMCCGPKDISDTVAQASAAAAKAIGILSKDKLSSKPFANNKVDKS